MLEYVHRIAEKVANELWGYFPSKALGEDSEVLLEKIHQECLKEGMTSEEARRETLKCFWEEDIDELENWIVGETEDGHMPLVRKPQHVIDEDRGDEIRQSRKEQAQREMYDDPFLNWSGLR